MLKKLPSPALNASRVFSPPFVRALASEQRATDLARRQAIRHAEARSIGRRTRIRAPDERHPRRRRTQEQTLPSVPGFALTRLHTASLTSSRATTPLSFYRGHVSYGVHRVSVKAPQVSFYREGRSSASAGPPRHNRQDAEIPPRAGKAARLTAVGIHHPHREISSPARQEGNVATVG